MEEEDLRASFELLTLLKQMYLVGTCHKMTVIVYKMLFKRWMEKKGVDFSLQAKQELLEKVSYNANNTINYYHFKKIAELLVLISGVRVLYSGQRK